MFCNCCIRPNSPPPLHTPACCRGEDGRCMIQRENIHEPVSTVCREDEGGVLRAVPVPPSTQYLQLSPTDGRVVS